MCQKNTNVYTCPVHLSFISHSFKNEVRSRDDRCGKVSRQDSDPVVMI